MIELSADNNSDDNRKALQSKILENVSSTVQVAGKTLSKRLNEITITKPIIIKPA